MPARALCYFQGDALRRIYDELTEYIEQPGAILTFKKDGSKFFVNIADGSGHGSGDLNDATNCPGGPRC